MTMMEMMKTTCSKTEVTNFHDNFDNDDVDGAIAQEQDTICTFHDNLILTMTKTT